jgi:putative glutamine amidotransferase
MPLIGIVTKRIKDNEGIPEIALAEAYTQAISQAGGSPVLIPLGLPDEMLGEMLRSLDGLLFSGGGDIETWRYGAESTPKVKFADPDRDRVEMRLVQDAVVAGLPFLGICRGLQAINVALGGTLYPDIKDSYPQAIEHTFYPGWPRDHIAHDVDVQAGSLLAEILGATNLPVNSLHHQAVDRLATGLKAIAHAPDGIIEGVILPEVPFGLAVQWHPECMLAHKPMRDLFRAFVEAAS